MRSICSRSSLLLGSGRFSCFIVAVTFLAYSGACSRPKPKSLQYHNGMNITQHIKTETVLAALMAPSPEAELFSLAADKQFNAWQGFSGVGCGGS